MTLHWQRLVPGELDHERLWASVALAGGVCFALAVRLDALPTLVCVFHALTGVPCPTCGSTRALVAFVSGRPLEAMWWNPLAGATALLAIPYLAYAVLVTSARLPRARVALGPRDLAVARAVVLTLLSATWIYLIAVGR